MSTSIVQEAPTTFDLSLEQRRRHAIVGAFLSQFIVMFDVWLPVIILSPIQFFFRPASASAGRDAILTSLVFVTTLLGRPAGAVIFGMLADRAGRRRASIYSVSGFGIVTLAIALLPGYERIGVSSYWLLVVLRLLDGFCLGGSYTSAMPLAFEYSKKQQRGLVGGLITAGFPVANVAINLLAMCMFALFPLNGPHSPYVRWGWRIPFVIGSALAGVLAIYYSKNVKDAAPGSDGVKVVKKAFSAPLREMQKRTVIQIMLLMTGWWFTQNVITLILPPALLTAPLRIPGRQVTEILLVTYTLLIFSYIGSGVLAQRIGRRRFFLGIGTLIATLGAGLLYLLLTAAGKPLPVLIALMASLSIIVSAPQGVIVTYINERFSTGVRATGFGIGYSVSVIIPALYAFYMNGLSRFMPFRFTPIVLLCLGGVIGVIGSLLGPETRDLDIQANAA